MLWWLVNFLSVGAFQHYKTIEDVLDVAPPQGEDFWMLDWNDEVLDKPVFPQWSADGPTGKSKGDTSWGNDATSWAQRAGFPGLTIHAVRREILIKVNGKEGSTLPRGKTANLPSVQTAVLPWGRS
jgi:hypothetical protein